MPLADGSILGDIPIAADIESIPAYSPQDVPAMETEGYFPSLDDCALRDNK
jgi:hypothetical protein